MKTGTISTAIVEEYCDSVKRALLNDSVRNMELIAESIREARAFGKRVWILGNGGSLAIAQHFAQDLIKLGGVKAHALTCPSLLTAYTNDEAFEHCFSSPLATLRDKDEPVIIFSCSGKSRNYSRIFKEPLFAIVGCDGGFLKKKSTASVHVNSDNYQICETAFCVAADLILKSVCEIRGAL